MFSFYMGTQPVERTLFSLLVWLSLRHAILSENKYIMSMLIYKYIAFALAHQQVTTPYYKLIALIAGSLGENMYYIWGYTFSSYLLIMYIIPLCLLSFTNYHLIKIIRSRKCFHRNRNNSENKVQVYLFIIHLFIVYNEAV